MKVSYTQSFQKDFQRLPKEIQESAEKKLEFFGDNTHHSPLKIKKMDGIRDIWEGRITDNYRFTFLVEGDVCILRRIGTHDIFKKEKQ